MSLTGAILGDIAGSRFEFEKEIPEWNTCEIFSADCVFTDDIVQSLSVGLAAISDENYADSLYAICNKYLFVGYGGNFHRWLSSPDIAPRDSWGNGAAMRVSAIGEIASSLIEAERMAEKSAVCTHDSFEGKKGAKAIAGCVYLARTGASKEDIIRYAQKLYPPGQYEYYVGRSIMEYRSEYRFEVSCQKSVPVAVQCFAESTSFEQCIRNVFFLNGDTDTLGAMAGAIAGSFYKKTGFDDKKILRYFLDDELYSYWERIENYILEKRE